MMDLCKVEELSYILTGDLKIYLILLCITGNSSRHSCAFCETRKDDRGVWIKDAKLRTVENIREHFEDFEQSGGNKKNVKIFF